MPGIMRCVLSHFCQIKKPRLRKVNLVVQVSQLGEGRAGLRREGSSSDFEDPVVTIIVFFMFGRMVEVREKIEFTF